MTISSRSQTHSPNHTPKGAAHNKDALKSKQESAMSGKPGAKKDQFGSRHNDDKITKDQRQIDQPGGPADLSFRESAQDVQPNRGAKNKLPGRRSPKSGDQHHH